MRSIFMTLLLGILILTGCAQNDTSSQKKVDEKSPKEKTTITISAAASLKDALEEIKAEYEKEHNVDIKINFGASGMLANQIKSGAPVDLFFSAAQDKVDELVKEKLIKKDEQVSLLKNKLVIVSTKNISNIDDLKNPAFKKIAVGTPETVPAGAYAKQSLENVNLWSEIESKIVFTKDVRQALTYVESENTDAGIVYLTDAQTTKLKVYEIADSTHDPITYPLAVVNSNKETKALYDYLQSDSAKKVYESYGFITK